MDLSPLLGFAGISLTLALTPGADWAYTIAAGLTQPIFDNFRLHDAKPTIQPVDTAGKPPPPGPMDELKYAGLPAD